VRKIATQTWMRNFDDRLGLSHEELRRYEGTRPRRCPATEQLLADAPHHIIPRGVDKALDPKYGFKVKVPQHQYNFGEVYNLSIARGTLSEEERFKINEHIIQTIVMLDAMPFPRELRRVPEYAGTHHETLGGTGYPRRLAKDELTVPGANHGHRRHLRGAHRIRSPVQEGEIALRIGQDPAQVQAGQPHRRGAVRPFPALRRLPALCRALPQAGTDRQGGGRKVHRLTAALRMDHEPDYANPAAFIGRIFLALLFVVSGVGKITGYAGTAAVMASKGLPMVDILLPLTIAVELGGGLLLALGWKARWAAAVLFLFLIPTTLIFHQFWGLEPKLAQMQKIHFLKNVAIMGGMLMVLAIGAGRWSVDRK
jgi:uncharacterized membrane protein YphA (DoxX/SURF4 family)